MNPKSYLLLSVIPAIGLSATSVTRASEMSATPCMDALHLFTAPGVPAFGPHEVESPVNWMMTETPPDLPGKGLAQHPMLYAGETYDKIFLINEGKVIWSYSTGTSSEYDDVWMLSNGNILYSRMEYVEMITPDKKVVWHYDCKKASGTSDHTEIHTCQPIGLDKVMFVENGLPPTLKIVNIKTGITEVDHVIPSPQPSNPNSIHGQYRRARVTAQGTYLLSVFGMGYVLELDKDFKEIWRYDVKAPWAALRLKNGNTLITNEGGHVTLELNPKKEIVWQFDTIKDLPEEYHFASAPQTATRLANGNTIFTSRGKSGKGPQLVEVTKDKKVVWVLQDWKNLAGATAVQILDDPGVPEIPGESEH